MTCFGLNSWPSSVNICTLGFILYVRNSSEHYPTNQSIEQQVDIKFYTCNIFARKTYNVKYRCMWQSAVRAGHYKYLFFPNAPTTISLVLFSPPTLKSPLMITKFCLAHSQSFCTPLKIFFYLHPFGA